MKQWEKELREEQRLTLPKRLAYALIGFITSGFFALGFVALLISGGSRRRADLGFTNCREFLHSPVGWLSFVPASVVVFFTLYGFLRGDRLLALYRRLTGNYADRPADDDDLNPRPP
jgi:hypothetical protein